MFLMLVAAMMAAGACSKKDQATPSSSLKSAGDSIYNDSTGPGGGHPGDTIHGDSTGCGGHHGGGHHGGGHGIPPDSLPALITDYITANFAGYSILHAEFDSLCTEGLVKEVMIGKQGSEPFKLVFSASNSFLFRADRIPSGDLPQAVKDYISTNYPAYQVCDRAEKFTMANAGIQYMVYLRQNQLRLKVRLQADGVFICSL